MNLVPDSELLAPLVISFQQHHCAARCHTDDGTCKYKYPRQQHDGVTEWAPDRYDYPRVKPEDTFINPYNPIMLGMWQGSMDIQLCTGTICSF